METILRFIKKLDAHNRIVLPIQIIKLIKSNEFYVELKSNGNIVLVPKEK